MPTVYVSEADATRDFAGLIALARVGTEVVIESDGRPVAVLSSSDPPRRNIEERIALLPEDSSAQIDEDFAGDVEKVVASHRE